MCYLRLDFESFDINGLSASTENTMTGHTEANAGTTVVGCQDQFTITVKFHLPSLILIIEQRLVINPYYLRSQ